MPNPLTPAVRPTTAAETAPSDASHPAQALSDAQMLARINLPTRLDKLATQGLPKADLQTISDVMKLWVDGNNGIADLRAQVDELKNHEIQKVNVPVGSILVCKDECPETAAHAHIMQLQMPSGLNGIADNKGDINATHTLLWTTGWSNAARQQLRKSEANAAAATAATPTPTPDIPKGKYWVYAPTEPRLGQKISAQTADIPAIKGLLPRDVEHFCRTEKRADGHPKFEFKGVLNAAP